MLNNIISRYHSLWQLIICLSIVWKIASVILPNPLSILYVFVHIIMSSRAVSLPTARNHLSLQKDGLQKTRTLFLCPQRTGPAWKLIFQQWQPPSPLSRVAEAPTLCFPCLLVTTALRHLWTPLQEGVQVSPSGTLSGTSPLTVILCLAPHPWLSFLSWPHLSTFLPVFPGTLPHKSFSQKSLSQDLLLEMPTWNSWYQKWSDWNSR